MTPERMRQIEDIFHDARERAPGEQAAFIAQACVGDDSLRREVEALLAADGQAGSLIETPAYAVAAPLIVGVDAQSLVGKSISHYQIIALLGKGGMGEVYRARDTKLDRTVALKILPSDLPTDADRMRRFTREAKAASALNHPHVATIYEIGEVDGVSFIAMEYVEGQTLAAKINGQPLAVNEIVEIGSQIADALDEAHGKGITHRDIKPANVMLTPRGQVKVLDFGLAKIARPAQPLTSDISTLAKTAPGVVLGTVPYMSPEQALGHEVDHRTDIFSLGVVLYEMATGRLPFVGATTSETLDRILHSQPDALARFNYDVPAELERIVRKCLEKERERRYQSALELLVDLKNLKRDSASIAPPAVKVEKLASKVKRHQRGVLLLLGILLIVGTGLAYLLVKPRTVPRVSEYRRITNDNLPKISAFLSLYSSLVTDGQRIYFSAPRNGQAILFQVAATGGEPTQIPIPFRSTSVLDISPNGSELLLANLMQNEGGGFPIWIMPVSGGSPRRLGDVAGRSAAWSPDGRMIVYAQDLALYQVNKDGTEARKLVTINGRAHQLRWSPDGSRLRFIASSLSVGQPPALWEVNADGSNLHRLLPDWKQGAVNCGNWTPDGKYYVFQSTRYNSTQIWALPESSALFAGAKSEPVQLASGPLNYYFPVPSRDGGKIFAVGTQEHGELIRYDATTQQFVPYMKDLSAQMLNYSKDREKVAYITYPERDLWRSNLDGSARLQLSFAPLQAAEPRWSPDGKQIAFIGTLPGKPTKVYLVSSEGGTPRQLMPDERGELDPSWSPDGNTLVFGNFTAKTIHMLELRTGQVSILPGSEGLLYPRWSPDGRYIAAIGLNSPMLYDFQTQKWTEIVKLKAGYVLWSRDSQYIYFDNASQKSLVMFRVRIADRLLEQVVVLKDLRLVGARSSGWIGLTADDAPLVLRDVGTQDIYGLEWQVP